MTSLKKLLIVGALLATNAIAGCCMQYCKYEYIGNDIVWFCVEISIDGPCPAYDINQ